MAVPRTHDGADPMVPVLELEGLEHRLRDPERDDEFVVTVDQCLAIYPGTFAAILGPSGCGKTTLLTILGLLRRPCDPKGIGCFKVSAEGRGGESVVHDVKELWRRNRQSQIERLRRRHIGFALQSGELLSSLTVRENIALPLRLNGIMGRSCRQRVDALLTAFGLDGNEVIDVPAATQEQGDATPHSGGQLSRARINKLSGGEYQRVVIARAIAHRPRIAFVDEPTSSLNRELARTALTQLKRSQSESGSDGAVVMITHDEQLADEFADLIIRMAPEKGRAAGRVVEISTK